MSKNLFIPIVLLLWTISPVFADDHAMPQPMDAGKTFSEGQRPVDVAIKQGQSANDLISQKNDLIGVINRDQATEAVQDSKPVEGSYSVYYRGQSAKIAYFKNINDEDTVEITWSNLGGDKVMLAAQIKKDGTIKCFEKHGEGQIVNEYSPDAVNDILTDMGRFIKEAKIGNADSLERKNLSKIQTLLVKN